MARVSCRCGEKLKVLPDSPERIECPRCGARIRLRRPAPKDTGGDGDGYVRFPCPCGRRLKVPAADRPIAGRCPDCGRVVPVPAKVKSAIDSKNPQGIGRADPDARTDELDANDLAQLDQWAARYPGDPGCPNDPVLASTGLAVVGADSDFPDEISTLVPPRPTSSVARFEAGMRICPRCQKPIHLGAVACRECGIPVPRS
jgi:DNA-directed RNA polymerase subunit RPC12/RpoP